MAVKHLQGHSTGHASSFCLAISLSAKGDKTNRLREHLVASQLSAPEKDGDGGKQRRDKEEESGFRAYQQQ